MTNSNRLESIQILKSDHSFLATFFFYTINEVIIFSVTTPGFVGNLLNIYVDTHQIKRTRGTQEPVLVDLIFKLT